MPLHNSLEKTGIKNSTEKLLNKSFPTKTVADILNASVAYLQNSNQMSKTKFFETLQKLFDEQNNKDNVSEFAEDLFKTAKQYSPDETPSDVQILHFETSIIRGLNKKLGTHIEFPIITYLRDLCVNYQTHLQKDMSFDEDGKLIEFNEDSTFAKLTSQKHQSVKDLIAIFSQSHKAELSDDQDKTLEEFNTQLANMHLLFSQTRDPWYIEFAKQVMSLGLINLHRYFHKGNLTHGDSLFHNATLALDDKNGSAQNHDEQPHELIDEQLGF
jgi:hypothetical protein